MADKEREERDHPTPAEKQEQVAPEYGAPDPYGGAWADPAFNPSGYSQAPWPQTGAGSPPCGSWQPSPYLTPDPDAQAASYPGGESGVDISQQPYQPYYPYPHHPYYPYYPYPHYPYHRYPYHRYPYPQYPHYPYPPYRYPYDQRRRYYRSEG